MRLAALREHGPTAAAVGYGLSSLTGLERGARHDEFGAPAESQKCYESLTAPHDPYLRPEVFWGTEMYQEANNQEDW